MKVIKNNILMLCFLVLNSLTFIRFYDDPDYWIIDILSHFIVQYALISIILFFICLWKKRLLFASLAAFLFFFNASVMFSSDQSAHAARRPEGIFVVYSANVYCSNPDLSRMLAEVKKENADIVLLLEVTPEHSNQLTPLIRSFPYHVINQSIETDGRGTVFLSRFPVLRHHVTKFSDFGNSLIEAELEIDDRPVKFYGTHFTRPDDYRFFQDHKDHFLKLAYQIAGDPAPAIAAGDFNATPYSPIFRRLLEISGMIDTRKGFGWQPSWPAAYPLLWLPIDHVLVTPGIQVLNRKTGSQIGSDHYPVIAELSLSR